MKNIIRVLLILSIIVVYSLSNTFDIDKNVLNIIKIVSISLFVFFEGNSFRSFNEEKYMKEVLQLFIIYIFWNISYLVFIKGILISNKEFIKILLDTILLKDVIFELFASLLLCNLFRIFLINKRSLTIVEFILIPLYIYFKFDYFIYIFIFNFGILLDRITFKSNNNSIINIIDNSYKTTYILNIFLINIFINVNFIKYNNISDLIGIIFLSYLLGIISKTYLSYFPIIRKLI